MRPRLGARDLAKVLLLALVYVGAAKAGLALAFENSSVTAVWAPTVIALATLVLGGRRLWPGIALGAALVDLLAPGHARLQRLLAAGARELLREFGGDHAQGFHIGRPVPVAQIAAPRPVS